MRRDNDTYYTLQADAAIDALLEYVPCLNGYIFEPCVGAGHLVEALKNRDCGPIITNDIDQAVEANCHSDARNFKIIEIEQPWDWVITNPPFSQAFPILKNLLLSARQGVAFLLRLTFLEPTYERGPWLEAHPPDLLIVLPRFSFTGDGRTDSVTCAWMVWYSKTHAVRDAHIGIRVYPKEK